MDEWKLVPVEPTDAMVSAGDDPTAGGYNWCQVSANDVWRAMLAAAPEPPHLTLSHEEAKAFQSWKGMDGACAFHLIERHANGWSDVARMMEAWLAANRETPNASDNRTGTGPG